ncbi:hypothetical protein FDZ86_13495 [Escherichia coli O157:H7]|nr:hypothetical protein FDZ86_13495 [Escherichia coli O157:H7]
MLPSETMIWQPEFTDKTLSRKPGAVHITLVKSLCVLVGISFLVMLVAIFFSTAWRVLTLSGLVG